MATFRHPVTGQRPHAPRLKVESFQTLDFQGRMVAVIGYDVPNSEPAPPDDSEDALYWSPTVRVFATAVGDRPVRYATRAEWETAHGSEHVWHFDWLMFTDDDTPLVRRNMHEPMYR